MILIKKVGSPKCTENDYECNVILQCLRSAIAHYLPLYSFAWAPVVTLDLLVYLFSVESSPLESTIKWWTFLHMETVQPLRNSLKWCILGTELPKQITHQFSTFVIDICALYLPDLILYSIPKPLQVTL